MLGALIDPFRLRQYFNGVVRTRQVAEATLADIGFVRSVQRAMVPTPFDRTPTTELQPFPAFRKRSDASLRNRRVAVVATGGSGALASLVGVARGLEEAGVSAAVWSVCSGAALFGFPLAAGIPAERVAAFTLGLQPRDYVDPDWKGLALLAPTLGRGFAGILRGERVEETYERLLGDLRLGELTTPCYAPVWNVEENRLEYIGPKTWSDLRVATAVRMAVALPLFIAPVRARDHAWCDGGLVDIFPVHPVLDIEPVPDVVVAVNGFYPPRFVGEDATGWDRKPLSIVEVAGQVRTCQQVELARENLARLEHECDVVMLDPVPFTIVRGAGLYAQFVDNRQWPSFMRAGRDALQEALAVRAAEQKRAS